jgi:hypothetical protein
LLGGSIAPVRRWRVLAGVSDPYRHVVHQIEITGGHDQAVPGCVGPAAPAKNKLDGSAGARPDSAAVGCCGRLQSWPRFGGRRAFDEADARQAVDHHRQRRSIRLGNSLIRGLIASLLFWVGSAHRLRLQAVLVNGCEKGPASSLHHVRGRRRDRYPAARHLYLELDFADGLASRADRV